MFTGRKSFLLSIFFLNLSTGFAQDSCVNTTLDWEQLSLFPSFPQAVDGHSLDLTFTDPSGAMPFFTPINTDFYEGNGSASEYDIYARLATLGSDAITLDIDLSGDPAAISFELYDVDGHEDPAFLRQEVLTINGSYQGNPVDPILVPTSQMQVSGNTVTAYQLVKASSADSEGLEPQEGTLSVAFNHPVDNVQIVYSVDVQAQNVSSSSRPGFGIGNIDVTCAENLVVNEPNAPIIQAVPSVSWAALVTLLSVLIGVAAYHHKAKRNQA